MTDIFLQPGDSTLLQAFHQAAGVTLPATLGGGLGLTVLSYSLLSSNIAEGPASARTFGTPAMGDLNLSRHADAFSVRLWDLSMRAVPLGVGADQPTFLRVLEPDTGILTMAMRDAVVTAISTSGGNGDVSVETLTLSFTEVLWSYQTLGANGPTGQFTSGWSLKLDRPIAAFST